MNRWKRLGYSCLLLATLLLFGTGSVLAQPAAQLAPGDPPLTYEMLDQAQWFYEWIFDAQMTQQQRTELREDWVKTWKSGNAPEIKGCLDDLEQAAQLSNYTKAERDLLREALLPDLLAQLRAKAPNDEGARWMLNLYDSAHQPIAGGNPPLTRQMADAAAEAFSFMISEVLETDYTSPDASTKAEFAQYLASQYPSYGPEQQQAFAEMPMYWAAIGVAWPNITEDKRASLREEWTELLMPMLVEMAQANSTEPEPEASSPSSGSGGTTYSNVDIGRSFAQQNLMSYMQHQTFLSAVNCIRGNYTAVYTYGPGPT